jgi:hypothetical protein
MIVCAEHRLHAAVGLNADMGCFKEASTRAQPGGKARRRDTR